MNQETMEKKVWYIAGASRGLGLALIDKLLSAGHRVASASAAAVKPVSNDFLPLQVDPSDKISIETSVADTWTTFGRIDVVVNAIPSMSVDLFAPVTVIKKVMPYLRAQGHGHIINMSSISGVTDKSVCDASKTALIAMSDNLAQDTRALAIRVTAVIPGAFRTQFLGQDPMVLPPSRVRYLSIDGRQPGDPVKAAAALMQIATMPEPPTLLVLGSDAYTHATAKMAEFSEQLTHSTHGIVAFARGRRENIRLSLW
jgi:NAD(P)-dependent dehydrogenase (short-subunit alcohol dehydrogenase family)